MSGRLFICLKPKVVGAGNFCYQAVTLKTPVSSFPLPLNFVNCYGCERYAHTRSRMNTGDNPYADEWGAVEFVPNPYNPPCIETHSHRP